uniref:gp53-like domain-containing protein n=1 Tax=Enterobacter asburiae TaxID=61645 RepID=UPI00292C6BD7
LGLVGGNFASGQGYSLNYFKIPVNTPSGLVTKIIQYGNVALTLGSDNKIGFPIPFPNAVRAWYATCNYTAGSGTLVNVNCVAGLSDITLRASASVTAFWLAIGE